MKTIEARISDLEKRASPGDSLVTWFISFVSPGPNGPVYDEPIGYTTSHYGDGVRWDRQPDETVPHLRERAGHEVPRNEHGAAALIECYADDTLGRPRN